MMNNTTLININRNERQLDRVLRTIESFKKINVPSDDPIIASRALKFRTSLSEIRQFQRNVLAGLSWMEVTESSFTDVVKNVMTEVKTLLTNGATDTNDPADRLVIVQTLEQLMEQIHVDMNQTYAGRYLFSGFRTDQPPVFPDDSTAYYRITQHFAFEDVEHIMSYQSLPMDMGPPPKPPEFKVVDRASVIKLAYKPDDVHTPADSMPVIKRLDNSVPPVLVDVYSPPSQVVRKNREDLDAYEPAIGTVNYIPETGEIIFHPDDVANKTALFGDGGIFVEYAKDGFARGELNPIVYFDCEDLSDNAPAPPDNKYNMNNQDMQYEFATNTFVTINSLAKNVYTDKMYVDFRRLIDFARSLVPPDNYENTLRTYYGTPKPAGGGLSGDDLERAVIDRMSTEKKKNQDLLQDRFNNMLQLFVRHETNAIREHTRMGNHMFRLELLQTRLDDDEFSYATVMSRNEDTEMEKAIMQKAMAEATFQASLQASSKMMTLTLANFMN